MKKTHLLIASIFQLLSSFYTVDAQPTIQWQKALGGSSDEFAWAVCQTADGGYIVTGNSWSLNGNVTGNHGDFDFWVVKLDSAGMLQWQKSLGGSNEESSYSVQQTNDMGYIVAGNTWSNNYNVTGNHGCSDGWLVKLDSAGSIQWQKTLGGSDEECLYSVQQTTDGGYVVTGYTLSNDGDVTGNHGGNDYWVVKLDTAGNIQWQKALGGTADDYPYSVRQTTDGGYVAGGHSWSNNGDVSGNHGGPDYWLVKLDSNGTMQWQRSLGGSGEDYARAVQQTADGGYIMAGTSASNDGNATGNHGGDDYWVVKLSDTGNIQWQRSLGGTLNDRAFSIQQTAAGGFVVAGYAMSNNGDISGNHGLNDFWVVQMCDTGSIQWQRTLGGTGGDGATSVCTSSDQGYVIAGQVFSNDGDVTGNHGGNDYWVVKLYDITTGAGKTHSTKDGFSIYPNPVNEKINVYVNRENSGSVFIITDILGQVILTGKLNGENNEIDLSGFAGGVYLISLNGSNRRTIKILKL